MSSLYDACGLTLLVMIFGAGYAVYRSAQYVQTNQGKIARDVVFTLVKLALTRK